MTPMNLLFAVAICQPGPADVQWNEAKVGLLKDGAHRVYHVAASGSYLKADLLCNHDECVGYLNGKETRGRMEMSLTLPYRPVRVHIDNPVVPSAPGNFVCP